MKKALFLILILALCLPAGCARPADPAPTEAPAASRYLALPWEEEVWSLAVLPETDTAEGTAASKQRSRSPGGPRRPDSGS